MNYFTVHDDDDLFVFREQTVSQIIKVFARPREQQRQRKKHEIARFSIVVFAGVLLACRSEGSLFCLVSLLVVVVKA
jgi:hypothetical protein